MQIILRLLVAVVIVIKPIPGWSLDVMQILSILSTLIPKPVKQPSPFAKEEQVKEVKPDIEKPVAAEKPTAVVLKDQTATEPKAEDK